MISTQFIFWIKYQSFRRHLSSCAIVSNFTVYLYTLLCIRTLLSEEKSIVDCLSENGTGWLPGIQEVMLPPSDCLFFCFFYTAESGDCMGIPIAWLRIPMQPYSLIWVIFASSFACQM